MASSALVPSPPPSPTYRVVKWAFVTPIFRLFLRGRCRGMELVPLNGPLVVVANHGSHLDPPLLGHALPRQRPRRNRRKIGVTKAHFTTR